MNLLDRLKLLVQSTVNGALSDVVHGLVGEDQPRHGARKAALPAGLGSSRISTAETEKLLRQADRRVDKLRDDLAGTIAREKRAEHAWREAGATEAQLNSEVDALLSSNQTDEARAKLQQAQRAAQHTADLERELQRFAKMSVQLRQDITELEEQLGQIRQRMQRAGEREDHVTVTEHVQHTQRKDTAQVTQAVQAQEEQVARREDRSDAKTELGKVDEREQGEGLDSSRMADVLKKMQEQRDQQNNKD